MGLGHLAVGLAAKPAASKAPLWVLLVATEIIDLLFIGFQAAGIEHVTVTSMDIERGFITTGSDPWSHGLVMSAVWSVVAALMAGVIWRDRRTGIVVGLVVFSHWVLDFIVHPDLPLLFESSPVVGFGLWNTGSGFLIGIILELCLLAGSFAIYMFTRSRAGVKS